MDGWAGGKNERNMYTVLLCLYLLLMQFYLHYCRNKPTLLKNCQTENRKKQNFLLKSLVND